MTNIRGTRRSTLAITLAAIALASCGGGPDDVNNPEGTGGQKLSFAYYQRCVQPILVAAIPAPDGHGTNTCASGGCHANATGTGGALRLLENTTDADLSADPATLRTTAMYKNYYSALATTLPGDSAESRLITKPLVRGVLHGGGQIFASDTDPQVQVLRYWIEHPAPAGQDEFGSANNALFTPPDPINGSCNTAP